MSRVMSRVIIYLGRLSPIASSDQPETSGHIRFHSVLLRMGFTGPLCYQQSGGLLHHLSTLTESLRPQRFISVALSLESPPPDVIRHPAL